MDWTVVHWAVPCTGLACGPPTLTVQDSKSGHETPFLNPKVFREGFSLLPSLTDSTNIVGLSYLPLKNLSKTPTHPSKPWLQRRLLQVKWQTAELICEHRPIWYQS